MFYLFPGCSITTYPSGVDPAGIPFSGHLGYTGYLRDRHYTRQTFYSVIELSTVYLYSFRWD